VHRLQLGVERPAAEPKAAGKSPTFHQLDTHISPFGLGHQLGWITIWIGLDSPVGMDHHWIGLDSPVGMDHHWIGFPVGLN
jgi:hypothetical protein